MANTALTRCKNGSDRCIFTEVIAKLNPHLFEQNVQFSILDKNTLIAEKLSKRLYAWVCLRLAWFSSSASSSTEVRNRSIVASSLYCETTTLIQIDNALSRVD